MKNRYWLIKRSGTFYAHDSETGRRESLRTKNKAQAQRLLAAKNELLQNTALNLQLGKIYLAGHDPKLTTRTWAEVMNQLASHGKEESQTRCRREMDSKAFRLIRDKKIVETTSDDLRAVLQMGKAATNNYLRRLQNLAVGLGWLPWPVLVSKLWPKVTPKEKRGITSVEHEAIIAGEANLERRNYYQMLWETGAAQSDGAALSAKDIDWRTNTLTYVRLKNGSVARLRISALALESFAAPALRPQIEDQINRARTWLLRSKPRSTEDLVFQLLGLKWTGATTRQIARLSAALLRQQQPDGGWSQLPTIESDAYATGQALYALQTVGAVFEHDKIKRGIKFLLQTQFPDGSWYVHSRAFPFQPRFNTNFPHGRHQSISAAGSSWAVLALLTSSQNIERLLTAGEDN